MLPAVTSDQIGRALRNGNSSQWYAVIKHQHINQDLWVRCQRCGKTWKPPIRASYPTDREFYRAVDEYEWACKLPTNNVTSRSVLCKFRLAGSVDAGTEYVRRQMANS